MQSEIEMTPADNERITASYAVASISAEKDTCFTKSNKLSAEGARRVGKLYESALEENGNDFSKLIDWCRDQERLFDPETQKNEVTVIRSLRGKAVYNAHLIWATNEYGIDKFGDESASNIMKYAKTLRRGRDINVYNEATELLGKLESVNQQLAEEARVKSENVGNIIENDIEIALPRKSLGKEPPAMERGTLKEELEKRLDEFGNFLLNSDRIRIFASAAVSVAIVTGLTVEYNSAKTNEKAKTISAKVTFGEATVPPKSDIEINLPVNSNFLKYAKPRPQKDPGEMDRFPEYVTEIQKPIVSENIDTNRLAINETKYLASDQESATKVAREIDFVADEVESPSNMCGPLAITLLKESGKLPKNFDVDTHDYWIAPPEKLQELLSDENFELKKVRAPVSIYDFAENPLKPGDVLFLRGGSFGHIITVTAIDKQGKAWTISNIRQADGTYTIEKVMLYDPQDDSEGFFRDGWGWPGSPHGWTGSQGFDLYRLKTETKSPEKL